MSISVSSSLQAATRQLLADAFGCALDEIPEDAALGSPAAWDSLGHMRLVLALEEQTGRALSPEEIAGIAELADVEALLARAITAAANERR